MSSSGVHPRGQRPGAMTMAMQAASAQNRPRVLRVGVVSGARIVEERVLDGRSAVTVGTSEACTFTVAGEGAPPRFELFAREGGRYVLQFGEGMDGRVATPQGVLSLEQLRRSGRARRTESGWAVALDEHSRGKVSVGDATFLFQFVVAPPQQPRPQLPVAIRARPMRNMDWAYNACFAGFLFMAFTALGYVEYGYDPDVQDNFSVAVPFVTAVANPPDAMPAEPQPPQEAMAAPTPAPSPDAPAPSPDAPHAPSHHGGEPHAGSNAGPRTANQQVGDAIRDAQRAADRALRTLENSAEWVALSSAANNARGSVRDGMAQGGTMNVDPTTLANAGGVLPGGARAGLTRRGDVSATLSGPNDLGRSHVHNDPGPEIGDGGPAGPVAPTGTAHPGAPRINGGEGEVDPNAVARVIGSSLGGIRACYNVQLRRIPSLSGRLTVSFTISGTGRVLGAPSTSGMAQSPELGQCVASRIRGLVFPAPQGGAVSFSFPFTFDANNAGR